MPLDWPTLITSAALSGTIAYATAAAKSGRTERGKQIHQAKSAVRDAVNPMIVTVHRYNSGLQAGIRRVPGVAFSGDDIVWAVHVQRAARHLGPTRRRAVRRRLSRLVGAAIVEIADMVNDKAEDPSREVTGLMLAWDNKNRKIPTERGSEY